MYWRTRTAVVALVGFLYLFVPLTSYGQELKIDVLDIGQGDSIFIQTPNGHRILIDGGPDDSVIDQLDQVTPFWDRRIDYILPTHPQADHIDGLVDVLQRFRVSGVLDTPAKATLTAYQSLKTDIEQKKIPEITFTTGKEIKTDDRVTLQSLWPEPDSNWNPADLNDVAQVDLLSFGDFKALFTADAGANIDQRLEELGSVPQIDVLKVAHHGSATGTDQKFLEQLHPLISVISVGAHNTYGHPAPSTLSQLKSVGTHIWRTDQDGRVEILVNKAGISVRSSKIQYNKPL